MVAEGQRLGLTLCIGAAEFWARARDDIAAARRRLFVQAMTFEGDAVGRAVAEAIVASPAADRRVLVDGYTRVNINDTPLAGKALRDRGLAKEVAATDAMFRGLIGFGVPVRVTNPVSALWTNYPARDHRKLIVADDVAYLGGINFSDHNFAWPDLMLRTEGADAANFLASDFEATFTGRSRASRYTSKGGDGVRLSLLSLDGVSNSNGFRRIFDLIENARTRIDLFSPYVTKPFVGALGAARKEGVTVRVFTPAANNKPMVRDALLYSAQRHDLEVVAGPVMSHLKGLLVDDEVLVVGSSNFDFASLAAEAELLAIIREPTVINDFKARVVETALAGAVSPPTISVERGAAATLALAVAAKVAASARRARRSTVDW